MRILATAFEAFGGEEVNPTMQLLEKLGSVDKLLLPVSFRRAPQLAISKIRKSNPDAVIMLGLAGGRTAVSLERVAINVMEAKNSDNDGFVPKGESIEADGPDAYLCRIPVSPLREKLIGEGIPCQISNSAGTYVCNALYYSVLHTFPELPAIFVHIPYSEEQASSKSPVPPSMSICTMQRAVSSIISKISDMYNM